ncbi:MAG: Ig-like domain-containing protein [Coriobacteriia bacterium]
MSTPHVGIRTFLRKHRLAAVICAVVLCAAVGTTVWFAASRDGKAAENDGASALSADALRQSETASETPAPVKVTGVSVDKQTLELVAGSGASLIATVAPSDAADKTLQWTSTDNAIVSVDQSGNVTAIAKGAADVVASASNGMSARCRVTVADPPPSPQPKAAAQAPAASSAPAETTPKSFHGSAFANSSQVIVVTANSMSTSKATLTTYQKSNGVWSKVMSATACVGKKGMVRDGARIEGGLQTPLGTYSLPYAFGVGGNPNGNGTSLPYKPVGSNTYYDGNYGSPSFNDLVEGKPAAGDNYEYMYQPTAYKYGIDVGFNLEQKPGKGNAIFIHCNTGSGYTAGCISISQSGMVSLLQWLDRTQHPVVLICLTGELGQYYR